MCGSHQESRQTYWDTCYRGWLGITLSLWADAHSDCGAFSELFCPLLPSTSNIATSPTTDFQIGTMINDPGKNLISCPVVQGWFPIKELTQDDYFLSTACNLLFNCGHCSLNVKAESIFELPFGEYSKESQNAKVGRVLKGHVIRPLLFL